MTEIATCRRYVFLKIVNEKKGFAFQVGVEERINKPLRVMPGFQQGNGVEQQFIDKDTVYGPPDFFHFFTVIRLQKTALKLGMN